MDIFSKTKEDELKFQEFITKVNSVYDRLQVFENEVDLSDIINIKKSFLSKTEDFFRNDRKLNIGIIGRVKAGKSSFLNTLLFEGRNILPNAVTPKTAALTKIEYDKKNRIEVEYYTLGEWRSLERKSQIVSEVKEFVAAKEVIKMVEERKIDPMPFIQMQRQVIPYSSSEELMGALNEYIGENGTYTPIVKIVTLYIDNPELEDISVVDTPGLYDPVLSRIDKTKQFMEVCDVVFFLSKATGFLDKNDIDLMAAQLPQKGVRKLVLVCSRFDDGLRDTIWTHKTLEEAREHTKDKLKHYARQAFLDFQKNNYHLDQEVIERCKYPIFVSSMAYNMSKKEKSEFSEQERKVYEDLNAYGDLTKEVLRQIGNMDEVRDIFNQVIEDKEIMLEEKAASFVDVAKEELQDKIIRIEKLAKKRIEQLERNDKESILQQKNVISKQVNKINASLSAIFSALEEKVEDNKAIAIRTLRGYNRDYLEIGEKEGTEKHFEIVKVSTSRWFAPWTWGTSKREIYSYEEKYEYVDVLEAIEKVRSFVNDGIICIEEAFNNSVNLSLLKHELLNVIISNLDVEVENYDPEYYKYLVEKTIQDLQLPVIEISTLPFENKITTNFSGEVVGHANKANAKALYAEVVSDVFYEACNRCDEAVSKFRFRLDQLKIEFSAQLLDNLNEELSLVLEQYDNKADETKRYRKLVEEINKMI